MCMDISLYCKHFHLEQYINLIVVIAEDEINENFAIVILATSQAKTE